MLRAEVERRMGEDDLSLADAMAELAEEIETTLARIERKLSKAKKTEKGKTEPVNAAADATPGETDATNGEKTALQTECRDVGEVARELQAADRSLGWDAAILAAHDKVHGSSNGYAMRSTAMARIPMRSQVRKTGAK